MMTKRGLLIVLSGPSGVGKDTVLREFLKSREDCALSVSATTRSPREGEEHGRDYFFTGKEEFMQMVASGEMLEWAEYSGNCYGTPRGPVEAKRDEGKHVILEIEVQGALQVKSMCPDAVMVFMLPPSMEVLYSRLCGRGTEPPEVVERRMAAARQEIAKIGEYNYMLVNDSVEESCKVLDAIVTAAGCSIKRTIDYLQEEFANA